ncbi:aspartyl protease [Rhizobium sp. PP-F2F-G38]|nr:aspartyl protease [Rhizobium sp. PP-WC-1G-195]PYE92119.1 aspartyl protease [Rhizobium sp. PP-F2F-G38]TCL89666.1 aspartyl protease [Rhizobium sp. PP-WC-2G-219]TCP77434.1 aspartyl protease [Rhizobium sp. PP-CC-2G-626]
MRLFNSTIAAFVAIAMTGAAETARASDLVFPIRFDEFSTPMVELELDGTVVALMLDTGSAEGLHLTRPMIERIEGARLTGETQKSSNIAGDVQENARFVVDKLTINGQTFHDVSGVEFTPWAVTMMGADEPPVSPVIGLNLFEGRRIVIDYQASTLTVSESGPEFDAGGKGGWTEVPLRRTEEGLLLAANIGGQAQLMSLDSGASMSMVFADRIDAAASSVPCRAIYPNLPETDCELVPVETEFGGFRRSVHAFLMRDDPGKFEGVGLLGGDFLFQHAVEIDLKVDRMFVRAFAP